ncbi:MAG: peptidylprolyl isomerase [Alphaproteobacteria bacterium]|nr:peptidylprolyl isomerase [Alphaproteobacteria bacterium]
MVGTGRTADARALFRDLANEHRDDACLQQAAAYTSIQDGELDFARPYLQAAEELAPTDPDIALLAAIVAISVDQDADGALRRLRPVAAAHPEHTGVNAWTGRLLLQRGDADLALPHLKRAHEGGADVVGALVLATRLAGDLDGYLRLVGASPPLPVDVRQAPSPAAALASFLGVEPGEPLTATLITSQGVLTCDLFWEQAPLTVGAFVGLSRGGTPWADPTTQQLRTDPLYPGTTFHRVIPSFMIQGGDPLGTGTGGPGYAFPDEIVPGLAFDRPGRLAMANAGPNTNGSQWFVTEVPVPYLDGKHTIFGQCDPASVDVVKAIARVPTGAMDKPLSPVVLESIEISPGAPSAP